MLAPRKGVKVKTPENGVFSYFFEKNYIVLAWFL